MAVWPSSSISCCGQAVNGTLSLIDSQKKVIGTAPTFGIQGGMHMLGIYRLYLVGKINDIYTSRLHCRGVSAHLLRPLRKASRQIEGLVQIKMALINARSVVNNTFILRDFFTARSLDFLFIKETWLSKGDSTPFTELLPPKCKYFNSPVLRKEGANWLQFLKTAFKVGIYKELHTTALNCSCLCLTLILHPSIGLQSHIKTS